MKGKMLKEYDDKRNEVITELNKLEQKFGGKVFRSACIRKMKIDSQRVKREVQIRQMEKELAQLKSGKPVS